MQTSGVFGALSDQVKKTIVDFVALGMSELEPQGKKLFNQKSTTSKFVRQQSIAPFGDMPAKGEGDEYSFDVIQPGYSKDITPVEYGFGFQWTETSQEDDEYDVLAQHAKWLGFSARVLQETKAAYVFNNGFGAQNTADGQDLFSTTHALKRGGTAKNKLSTDSDLSVASLQTMLADMMVNTKLESGQKVRPARDLYLWCHPDNLGLAYRICKASGLPQSADNDPNPINAYGTVTPLAWEYLDDSDAWGLIAKKASMHGLIQLSRVKPKLSARQTAWQTGNLIVTIRSREVWDAFDWRNTAGTPGA
jgi:hypothetical protein